MMTCQQLVELLLDFVSGGLDAAYCHEIRQHMHECPSCEAYVDSYKLTITITRQLPPLPLPTHLAQRLQRLLQDMTEGR